MCRPVPSGANARRVAAPRGWTLLWTRRPLGRGRRRHVRASNDRAAEKRGSKQLLGRRCGPHESNAGGGGRPVTGAELRAPRGGVAESRRARAAVRVHAPVPRPKGVRGCGRCEGPARPAAARAPRTAVVQAKLRHRSYPPQAQRPPGSTSRGRQSRVRWPARRGRGG